MTTQERDMTPDLRRMLAIPAAPAIQCQAVEISDSHGIRLRIVAIMSGSYWSGLSTFWRDRTGTAGELPIFASSRC